MKTSRLEAFSDGVLAIVITIMVLELKVPIGSDFETLKPLIPKFLSYILSFVYLGIYWNNHHHLFQAIEKVNGQVLWANLALLFTLSMVPFTTAWMGENNWAKNPVALYGINLLLSAIAFLVLERTAIKHEGKASKIGLAIKNHKKEILSIALYIVGVIGSIKFPILGILCYALVALIWLTPDSRVEKQLKKSIMTTKEYTNGEVTILWKPEKCIHSGICVKTLPKVYNPKEKPWVKPENASSEELINQVAKCPSGALSIKK